MMPTACSRARQRKTGEPDATRSESVEVRRLHVAGAEAAEVAVALVIRDDEQDIRLGRAYRNLAGRLAQGVGGGSQA